MVIFVLLVGPLLAGLYLILAGQVSQSELVACAAVCVGVTAYAAVGHRRAERRFAFPRDWPLVALRSVAQVFPDTFRVGAILGAAVWRRPDGERGRLTVKSFDAGGDTARGSARRAIAALAVSVAPNDFAIDLDAARGRMLVHQLAPAPAEPPGAWPR